MPMPQLPKRLIGAGLLVAATALHTNSTPSGPAPIPLPPDAPNMQPVFSGNQNKPEARQHASSAAGLFSALADMLEYDGSLNTPKITSGKQLQTQRITTRDYMMQGWSFNKNYQSFGDTIQKYLDSHAGVEPGPLNPDARKKWIDSYRILGRACKKAQGDI